MVSDKTIHKAFRIHKTRALFIYKQNPLEMEVQCCLVCNASSGWSDRSSKLYSFLQRTCTAALKFCDQSKTAQSYIMMQFHVQFSFASILQYISRHTCNMYGLNTEGDNIFWIIHSLGLYSSRQYSISYDQILMLIWKRRGNCLFYRMIQMKNKSTEWWITKPCPSRTDTLYLVRFFLRRFLLEDTRRQQWCIGSTWNSSSIMH